MNVQKTPLARSLNLFGERKALDEIRKRGGMLPGKVLSIAGQIVTVKIEVEGATFPGDLQMPVATCEYIRKPIQVGDLGVAIPSATYLGGVTGLGGGTADTGIVGNLSALVWLPVAHRTWPQSGIDPNALVLRGPNGVVLEDETAATKLTLTPTSITLSATTSITLQVGGKTIVITSSGITIEGREFLAHTHSGVQTGGGVSGGVV